MNEFFDTDKAFCSILLDVLSEKGVVDVVCSPGSRNTPLLIGVAARNEFNKHIIVDERSAAFVALGLASVSRRPVALICTSGTALLNYAPAVAEAFYQGIPLIIISADRPQQWIDQDDSQTLRQFEALSNFVKQSYELPAIGEEDKELLWYANRIANDAMIEALKGRQGPVHINIRFGEPLGQKIKKKRAVPRIIQAIEADSIGNKEIIKNFSQQLSNSKILLVAGFLPPDARLHKEIGEFSKFPNVVVMAETLSNLHLEEETFSVDSTLTAYSKEMLLSFHPDIVISLGGSLVSRKLKEYIRGCGNQCQHWIIGKNHTTSDCFLHLTLRIEADPARFLRNINKKLKSLPFSQHCKDYKESWNHIKKEALRVKEKFIKKLPWSELAAFDKILKNIPRSCNLFLSNGTTVRYAQIIQYKLPHASYCNRGVSGIDGSTSTAVGGALAYKGHSVLITGDLSLIYDIGILGFANIPDRMKIIVIDNQGGGIFRFVSSTSHLEEREKFFCASPEISLKDVVKGFGWDYLEADNIDLLLFSLKKLFASTQKSILRVVCDGIRSAEILKNYMEVKVVKDNLKPRNDIDD